MRPIFKKGSIKEQQKVLSVLGDMPVTKASVVLEKLLNELFDCKLSKEIS